MARKPYAHTYTRVGKVFKPHHRLSASGVFVDNSNNIIEEWSTSVSVGAPAGDVAGATGDAALLAAAVAFWSSIIGSASVDSGTKMTEVKVAEIDTVLVDDKPKSTYNRPPVVQATSVIGAGALRYPTEVACAVTLDTQVNHKHSGRFYVPGPSFAVSGTRRFQGTQALADTVGAAADALNVAVGAIGGFAGGAVSLATVIEGGFYQGISTVGTPGPMSLIVPSLTVEGVNRRVGQVRVGDVADVITRRRNKMREVYAIGAG